MNSRKKKPKPVGRLKEAGLLRLMENAGKDIDDEELYCNERQKALNPATSG